MKSRGATILLAVCAACAHTPAPMTLPEYEPHAAAAPAEAKPRVVAELEPELVPYPGVGVSLVANVREEAYCHHGSFYCFLEGRWFRAEEIGGPWEAVAMKYVPVAIYRVRGHLPPELEREAREKNREARVSLVSFRLIEPE